MKVESERRQVEIRYFCLERQDVAADMVGQHEGSWTRKHEASRAQVGLPKAPNMRKGSDSAWQAE